MTNADLIKLAIVLARNFILKNNLQDKVQLLMCVHDQIDTQCVPEVAQKWANALKHIMESAAKIIIPSGLMKAECTIMDKWGK